MNWSQAGILRPNIHIVKIGLEIGILAGYIAAGRAGSASLARERSAAATRRTYRNL